jgi:hypothetical protein
VYEKAVRVQSEETQNKINPGLENSKLDKSAVSWMWETANCSARSRAHVCVCMYVSMCLCVCVRARARARVCMYECMCVCVCVYIYIYLHLQIYVWIFSLHVYSLLSVLVKHFLLLHIILIRNTEVRDNDVSLVLLFWLTGKNYVSNVNLLLAQSMLDGKFGRTRVSRQ